MALGMVARAFVMALVGAVFGYVLGWAILLSPFLNSALLPCAAVGIGIARLPPLLAALGLLAGIAAGVLLGVLAGHARRRRHSLGRTACRRSRVGDSLDEIDGCLSFLEDMPRERVAALGEKVRTLDRRLARLKAYRDGA